MIYPPLKCACVSFPRSGHHALYSVLADYFGDALRYHDVNYPPEGQPTLEESNYTKNHDFKLETPIVTETRYIIQTRNPVDAVQSWMDFDARAIPELLGETRDKWESRFGGNLQQWTNWYRKWVIGPVSQRLEVRYERLIADPTGVCQSILQFMTGHHADQKKLADALNNFPIKGRTPRFPAWVNTA